MSDLQNNQYQAPVAPAAPAAPVAPQAPQGFNLPQANASANPVDQAKDMAQKVLKNKNLPMIAGIAVAVVVVIFLASLLFGKSYEKALKKYFDATYKGKTSNIEDMLPKEVWEYYLDEYDELSDEFDSTKEMIAAVEENYADWYEEYMDDSDYGEFKKYDYDIEKAKKVSDSKLEKIAESLSDKYDIDEDDVKKAYKLKLDGEIVFEDDEEDVDGDEYYAVKIGGKWYIVDGYEDYYYFAGSYFVEFALYED